MVRYDDHWNLPPDRHRAPLYSEHRSSREHSPPRTTRTSTLTQDRSRRQHTRHSYDADHGKPSSPSYSASAAGPRRQSWPPSPVVEDEQISLAKEANPSDAGCEDVDPRLRGSLDQTPIILEADLTPAGPSEPNIKKQRSNRSLDGVLRGKNKDAERSAGNARTEKNRRPNAPRFREDFPGAPELSSRSPSTYAFTPKARTPDAREESRSAHDSGYFSMSDSRSSASGDKRKDILARSAVESIVSDALRGQGKTRESSAHHQRQPSGPGSASGSVVSEASSVSSKASNNNRPRLAELKKEALHAHRRSSESATTISIPDFGPASPSVGHVTKFSPSPPRSPKHSPNQSREDIISKSGKISANSSLPGSRANSRPSSPKPLEYQPQPDGLRRVGTIPSIPDDRTQRTSRLVSSESVSHEEARTPKASSTSLPYPVDDMNLMPSEDDHRYRPRGLGIEEIPTPSIPGHRSVDKRPNRPDAAKGDHAQRPRLDSRHTYGGENALPALATAAAALASPTALDSPWSASSASSRGPRPPPPCPRSFSIRGYDDWRTLENLPDFDICPTCYEANFADGPFTKSFKRAHHSTSEKLKCDFSSPWIRLAWLLTLKQHRADLDCVYAVARAGLKEHCPGDHRDVRVWYTVKDGFGEKVENFDVCLPDVKRVEALLPSMRSIFTRAHHGQSKKRKCDFRVESKRFQEYLDSLIDIDDVAHLRRRQPDYTRFADLASRKAQMRECPRDDLVLDLAWHFPPQLPEFTVCEECYSEVVWPAIADGSAVASRFHRTPQLVYSERRSSVSGVPGTSCQLYSNRMRKVFKKAVQSSDFAYLARRAQERKDVEDALQGRIASINRLSADLASQGIRGGSNTTGLLSEMDRLRQQWSDFE